MKKIKIEFNIPVSVIRENKKFIAYTPALDLSTSGDSYSQAKQRFNEIVNVFFEELVKKDTLEPALLDLGWKKVQKKWIPPVLISQESQNIQVPIG